MDKDTSIVCQVCLKLAVEADPDKPEKWLEKSVKAYEVYATLYNKVQAAKAASKGGGK